VPETERQAQSLEEITGELDALSSPRVDLRHSYYQDSDRNQHHRYLLTYGFGLGNTDLSLRLVRTDSRGDAGTSRSRSGQLDFTTAVGNGHSVGAGLGISRPGTGGSPMLVTGRASFTTRLSNGQLVLTAEKDVLSDTAELIANRVRMLNYGARIEKPLSDRVTVSGEYHYRDFSDGNHAHDVQVAPAFTAVFRPRITLGYQLRYQDYRTQSGMGYFDPDGYVAHRASASVYHETASFYTYGNVFVGRQSFTRHGFPSADTTVGGGLSVGVSPAEPVTIEVNAEGGNFRAGSVSGFSYFSLGSRVQIMF
jgi:hypothetical protein